MTHTPTAAPAQEPSAWMHPDGHVIPAATKAQAEQDGGAMKSSVAGYSIPLFKQQEAPSAQIAALEQRVRELEGDVVDLKGDRDSWEQQAAERLKDWDEMRQRAEAAEQRVRELEADAARYRWLREQIDTGPLALCEEISSDVHHRWSPIAAYCDEYVDAAIDSARGVEG